MKVNVNGTRIVKLCLFNSSSEYDLNQRPQLARGAWGMERQELIIEDRKNRLEHFDYGDQINGKAVVQFSKLTVSIINYRISYYNGVTNRLQSSDSKLNRGSKTRQRLEVLVWIGQNIPNVDGTEHYFPVCMGVLHLSGFQATKLAYQIAEEENHFREIMQRWDRKFRYYWFDLIFSDRPTDVGQSYVDRHHNGIQSTIFPLQIAPHVVWPMKAKDIESMRHRRITDEHILCIDKLYENSKDWVLEWDAEKLDQKEYINQRRSGLCY
jgi:hypothetical protein